MITHCTYNLFVEFWRVSEKLSMHFQMVLPKKCIGSGGRPEKCGLVKKIAGYNSSVPHIEELRS